MKYNLLGKSDLNISRIGLGCMSLPPSDEAIPVIHRALDLGINYFDTADIYHHGKNEELIGKALRGKREEVILASKAGNVHRADGSGLDWNPSKEHILQSIEGSLKRLQTDYIDLYQLHGGTIHDNIDETIEAFELLKKQGKIRHYGISSIRPNVIREYIKRSSIVSVMTQYSLLDRRPEEETLDLLLNNNIGVLVRGSVAQGLLINKPARPYLELDENEVRQAAEAVSLTTHAGSSATHTAIRYVLHHPAVSSAVVGIRNIVQLEQAAGAADEEPLPVKDMEILRKSVKRFYYKEHR